MKNWYVVYTKPNGRKVAEQLTKMGIECYCPWLLKCANGLIERKVVVTTFNSYVFVQVADSDRA
jgi:transcription antitermination factor NusG